MTNSNGDKPILNIGFWGFWDTDEIIFNHYFKNSHRFLFDKYDVRCVSDKDKLSVPGYVDVLFCSIFFQANNPLPDTTATKILLIHENMRPSAQWFDHFDYIISFAHDLQWNKKHKRIPYWIYRFYEHDLKLTDLQNKKVSDEDYNRRFCSFVYSNPFEFRRNFAHKLSSSYQQVEFGGRLDTNVSDEERALITPSKFGVEGLKQKRDWFNRYKFSIAFENSSTEGYTTEKIIDSFAGRTIPIYWGDLRIKKDGFNPKAFLNYMDTPGDDIFINRIRQISEDKNAYLEMLQEPMLSTVPELLHKRNMLELYANMIERKA